MRFLSIFALAVMLMTSTANAATITLHDADMMFVEETITAHVGDVLSIENSSHMGHVIVVHDGDATTNLGSQKVGQTLTYTFAHAGEYKIVCPIHPKMKITIEVK
jgi:plastocyanin